MKWIECKKLIESDYVRVRKPGNFLKSFLRTYYRNESFRTTLWFRIGSYLMTKRGVKYKPFLTVVNLIYTHVQHKTGIQLPLATSIQSGLRFFHYNCIIIAQSVKIGENASIHQGVTIGRVFAGPFTGVPTIGDNVVIFAGAKLLGNIKIGDNAVIGANAVVTRDVPPNSVAAGVPAKIISDNSSKCFDKRWGKEFCHSYIEQ